MKKQKTTVTYLLIISFLLTACAIPFIGTEPDPENRETTAAPTNTPPPSLESTPTEIMASPTSQAATESPSEPETQTDAIPEEATSANSLCYNPYFPVLPDKTWHYRTTTTGLSDTDQYQTYDEITDTSFIARQEIVSESTFYTDVEWFCSEEGLVNAKTAMANLPVMPANFQFESGEFSGVSYPPSEEWVIGHTWTGNWQMTGTAEIPNVGTTTSNIKVTQENVIAAIEPVTVPAGSYEEAVRIDSSLTIEVVAVVGNASSQSVSNTFRMSAWYVEGVGLVKEISTEIGFVMELQSVE